MIHVEETDSFGRRLSNTPSPLLATLNFAGGLRDTDTGLIHFFFRDYDPATGFFIQPDPLGLRGGDVDVYGYCLDAPVNLVDPLGLKGKERNDVVDIFGRFTPTHPIINGFELYYCRDLDGDGDSCWWEDNDSAEPDSRQYSGKKKGKSDGGKSHFRGR